MLKQFRYYPNDRCHVPMENGEYSHIITLSCDHGVSHRFLLGELGEYRAAYVELFEFCSIHSHTWSCNCATTIIALFASRPYFITAKDINLYCRN